MLLIEIDFTAVKVQIVKILKAHIIICYFLPSNFVQFQLYIVYMGEKKHKDPDVVTASHHNTLKSIFGRYYIWPDLKVMETSNKPRVCFHYRRKFYISESVA